MESWWHRYRLLFDSLWVSRIKRILTIINQKLKHTQVFFGWTVSVFDVSKWYRAACLKVCWICNFEVYVWAWQLIVVSFDAFWCRRPRSAKLIQSYFPMWIFDITDLTAESHLSRWVLESSKKAINRKILEASTISVDRTRFTWLLACHNV